MKKIYAVIGTGFGDEGKGVITDYLTHKIGIGIVVRYNGSGQCGHTVELENGTRHVFSHFGSGTFNGWSTLFGHKCVVNPLVFMKEREELIEKGYEPIFYAHKDCFVTTPYDMFANQILEKLRGDGKHGSCGLGFGETIERNENHIGLQFNVSMLKLDHSEYLAQVERIKEHYIVRRISLEYPDMTLDNIQSYNETQIDNINVLIKYSQAINYFKKYTIIVDDYSILNDNNIVFEGAQGLQLDQDHENFPYVTRSNTGIKNIIEILNYMTDLPTVELVYVTRTYTTKHGAGPLLNEEPFPEYLLGADKTNVSNRHQDELRYAPLNVDLLYNSIIKDTTGNEALSCDMNTNIAITWIDIVHDNFPIIVNGKYWKLPYDEMMTVFTQSQFQSYGPTRNTTTGEIN